MNRDQRKLANKYLVYETLTSLWFIGAVWLYFYRLFINDQQVGVLDGLAFAIGLLAEVPSGALADRFGRDKVVRLGQFLAGSGLLIQAFGSSFIVFMIGQATLMVGSSFISGADEALFFGNLRFDHGSVNWRKLVTRVAQVSVIGSLLANVAGGWLYTINPRVPWILTGLAFISSVLFIWSVKDTRQKKERQKFSVELHHHLISIKNGFGQFFKTKLSLYIPIIIAVQGLFYTAGWGLLRLVLLSRFHFSPFWGSIVIATSGILTVGILALMHKYAENMSERNVITFISLAAFVSLLLSLANIGVWGYFVIFALYAGEHVLYPFMSEVLNNQAPEDQRATVLSVASFLRVLPYVALAPIIGYLNTRGHLEYFLITWSVLIIVALIIYLKFRKKDSTISMIKKKIETETVLKENYDIV